MATMPVYYTEEDYKRWCDEQVSCIDESEVEALIAQVGNDEKAFSLPAPVGSPPSFADRLSRASVNTAVMGRKETFFFGSQTFACWWEGDILFWIEVEASLFPY